MNELQDLSLEISEKLNRIYAYLTPKLNRIISKYSYKYNLLPLVSQNRNFGSNSANSEKKSTFNELIEMCDKIEIAYQKSQRVVEQNSSNISNVDTIAGKLETMAVMNRKARVVRQRQALSVGEARRTLSQLKTMHSKVSDLFEGIVFESSNVPKKIILILKISQICSYDKKTIKRLFVLLLFIHIYYLLKYMDIFFGFTEYQIASA